MSRPVPRRIGPRRAAPTVFLLIALCLPAVPLPASALNAEQVVRPWRDEILLCTEAQAEIDRRAGLLAAWLDREKQRHQSLLKNLARLENIREAEHQDRLERWEAIMAAAGKLAGPEGRRLLVPGLGWTTPAELGQGHKRELAVIAGEKARLAAGQERFHLPGEGWVTRSRLSAGLTAREKEAAELAAQMTRGGFVIEYPELGRVDRRKLERKKAAAQAEIRRTLREIEQGAYRVHLPHLGWTTRRQLDEKIANLTRRLSGLKRDHAQGRVRVNARPWGWIDRAKLAKFRAEEKARLERLGREVEGGSYRLNLDGKLWLTGSDLDKMIADGRGARQEITRRFRDRRYPAECGALGRLCWEQIDARLEDPHLGDGQRRALERCRQRALIAFELEDKLLDLDDRRWKRWQEILPGQAALHAEMLESALSENQRLTGEFPKELSARAAPVQRELDYLTACRSLLP